MIETKRVFIRKEQYDDAINIQRLLLEPEGRRYTGGVKRLSIEQIEQIIQENINNFSIDFNEILQEKKRCIFSIIKKDSNQYVGSCGFLYCKNMGEVEITYSLFQEFWNKGIGTEVAKALLCFGFTIANFQEVFAAVHPTNIASERILQKIGMIFRRPIPWPEQGMVHQDSIRNNEFKIHI